MRTRSSLKIEQELPLPPQYPESYDESDQLNSGITEYDFYEASKAWRRNKKAIGGGYFVYKSKAKQMMWYVDSDDE